MNSPYHAMSRPVSYLIDGANVAWQVPLTYCTLGRSESLRTSRYINLEALFFSPGFGSLPNITYNQLDHRDALHLLRVCNAWILSKRRRPETAVKLLLWLQVVQHLVVINGTSADHSDVRLSF